MDLQLSDFEEWNPAIADYKHVNISKFDKFDMCKNDDLHSNCLMYSFILIHSKYAICCLLLSLYGTNQALEIFAHKISPKNCHVQTGITVENCHKKCGQTDILWTRRWESRIKDSDWILTAKIAVLGKEKKLPLWLFSIENCHDVPSRGLTSSYQENPWDFLPEKICIHLKFYRQDNKDNKTDPDLVMIEMYYQQ